MIADNAAEAAALRVAVLQGHLAREQRGAASTPAFDGLVAAASAATAASSSPVSAPDDGEVPSLVQYSVALPERLEAPGPWAVRRYEG